MIFHTVRSFIVEGGSLSVLLKVDFRNAFNTVDRSSLLEAIGRNAPGAFGYFTAAYGVKTPLLYEDHIIWSEDGVQQGDPLGPIGFSLTVNAFVHSLKSSLNAWYLDDATLGGDPEALLGDLVTLIREASRVGLS